MPTAAVVCGAPPIGTFDTPMSEPTIQQLFDLTGRVALLSGASGYLGSAFAAALAEAGATVVVSSRDKERAERAAAALPSPGGAKHCGVVINQLDESTIASGFDAAVAHTGQLDILINNGHAAGKHDWKEVTGEEFNQQLANATGYFLLARRFREHIVEAEGQREHHQHRVDVRRRRLIPRRLRRGLQRQSRPLPRAQRGASCI